MGHLAGLHRTDQILKSSEAPFLAKLSGLEKERPVATTFSRFHRGFENKDIENLQGVNFDLATKNGAEISGYQMIVHDQSAIQKYGNKMEGVEKGYGGTLKRGSKLLQCSIIADAGRHLYCIWIFELDQDTLTLTRPMNLITFWGSSRIPLLENG